MTRTVLHTPAANVPGDRRAWGSLPAAAQSLAIVEAALGDRRLCLVIADSAASATQLEAELRFFAAGSDLQILHLPDWETLPYDVFSPHQDIVSERLHSLYRLPRTRQGILVAPITTLLQRLAPPSHVVGNSFVHRVGESLDVEKLRLQLESAGYRAVDTVYEHGEFAVRGSLIDIFPMGSPEPLRIDLMDDEIDSLRTFDPETQVSLHKQDEIRLLPAREFPFDKPGIKRFLDNWHDHFDVDVRKCTLYQDVKGGIAPQGIEYYLPLFFDQTATLFDYLPQDALIFTGSQLPEAIEQFWREVSERYEEYRGDRQRPLLPPAKLYLGAGEVFAAIGRHPRTDLVAETAPARAGATNFPARAPDTVAVDSRATNPLLHLETLLMESPHRTLFCAESAGRREALLELLGRAGIQPAGVAHWGEFVAGEETLAVTTFPLERGLTLDQPALRVITESQLFGQQVMQRRRRGRAREGGEMLVRDLTELKPGAPVVHLDHGVGRYLGLQTLAVDGASQEFLTLAYADDAKLYVPVANLHLISRYGGGDPELAPLHRLGSEQWQRARDKASQQIRDTAAELLDIHARRAARVGHAFGDPGADYLRFCAEFPFEETPDQQDAIDAVLKDMLAPQPMDRLVCGDVGFGKTEVAMRAAFIAVASGKQVLVLVPTTLLAQQHYENFRDRFSQWPVTVEVISRFKTGKEQDALLRQVSDGKVDILIGTHKLLHNTVDLKQLGLLIIDEEHRFGVQQKEKIKALRAEVDILTLTATPIPRTLNMAMGGLRDLSIIATPPARRLSVKTFVRQRDDRVIREAIMREILRGGQVYFLHNDVKSMERTVDSLRILVPEARIGFAHGQMRERELERVMSDFYHQRFNILVCSTIIETGIDIPSANTIIIERADKFGLAQLHQLRGRVGRSHHQAYAYLLTPEPKAMTDDAVKRLDALAEADHLGSGFTLATHDLEIRGAGELLGEDQSGHIHSIGFTLYMTLLEKAVKAIQSGRIPDLDAGLGDSTEVNLNLPALIPDDYLPDVNSRLILYKRISATTGEDQLRELQVEMIDRFGLLPEATKTLFRVALLRQRCEALGIRRLDAGPTGGKVEFGRETPVDPMTIVQLVQQQPNRYRLAGATEMKFTAPMESAEERLETVAALLDTLQAPAASGAPTGKKAAGHQTRH
ncbi:MAG: transcription-repair coupling factor [Porticoccaceae bacterium]|jgi:transcription-repair coupling factor (superfamily II helicase)|nr:transcription-repair coupling factor [Porticoccaceae bacterium]HLS98414.1 transcription-repair coupling factor [Porticoccaceae bacterium]